MQLKERIEALATRIANHFRDAVMPRLLPPGGAAGQILGKTAAGDYAVAWQAAGGGAGAPWVSAEADLGVYAPVRTAFVAVAGMLATERVEVRRGNGPATAKGSDEHLAEPCQLAAFAAAGGFTLQAMAAGGSIGGPMIIDYRRS